MAAFVGLSGCHRDDDAPYPEWVSSHTIVARKGAYAELKQLGIQAEAAVRGLQRRASPSGREVREIDSRLEPIISAVPKATSLTVVDDFEPEATLNPSSSRIGWAAIGGAYERKLHVALVKQDYDEAVRLVSEGTRFALIISCGDAGDALVGYPIADSLRRMLAPQLQDLSPAQLSKLAHAVSAALLDRLPNATLAIHQRLSMLASVQAVQNGYRDGHLKDLEVLFGPTARDAFDALENDKGRAETKRAAFFRNVVADVEAEASWLESAISTPAAQRSPEPNPKLSSKQPWHALSRHLMLGSGALLAAGDLTIARTRLLALSCDLYAMSHTAGSVPRDLRMFPTELNKDPYTGKSFYYVPEGLDFILYSAGVDGVDNGGDTDEAGLQPDLKLEGAN